MDSHLEPASAPINGALRTGECLNLLRSVAAGRLIYTDNALPAVWPVTFAAPDGQIVIPTGGHQWFDRFDATVVALEAGAIASATRTGWTVLAIGRSRLVIGTDGLHGFDDPTRAPWTEGPDEGYLVFDIERLTGHRAALLRPTGDHR
ncbi:pyridoxamine 5'-phosphate oxidase family protein [Rhodococcus sp. NPDC057529]|uniref:pyridoxamine 5'-phosphate oxidase family protein n=1 Tax=Rhodococcus sp. NPDC057529 TaxID=3346158 RepID=UPI00366BE725